MHRAHLPRDRDVQPVQQVWLGSLAVFPNRRCETDKQRMPNQPHFRRLVSEQRLE